METVAHILGWVLLAAAGLIAMILAQMSRDHARQSTFKKFDREMLLIGLVFLAFVASIGALIVWLTWPAGNG